MYIRPQHYPTKISVCEETFPRFPYSTYPAPSLPLSTCLIQTLIIITLSMSTVHYVSGHWIRELKSFEKLRHIFYSILIQIWKFQFWVVKTVKNLMEKYCHRIFVTNVTLINKKHVAGVSETWNFARKQISLSWKKELKIIFFTGARNIVKMESEIYKYLP